MRSYLRMWISSFNCLALSAFALPFNLPVARGFLVLSFITLARDWIKKRRWPAVPVVMWLSILFLGVAAAATVHGVDPGGTFHNLRKLLWYAGILVFFSLADSRDRLNLIMKAFAAGGAVLAVWTIVLNPVAAFRASGDGTGFFEALINQGSMTDAQRLMACIIVTAGQVVMSKRAGRTSRGWIAALLLQVLALLVTFKRGSWICLVMVSFVLLVIKAGWRYSAGLVLAAALLAFLPPVRERLSGLSGELDVNRGGRLTMWLKIAPEIHRERPWLGVGWRALTNEMMKKVAPNVEDNRTHLHSNPVEIIVETGWIGFTVYIAWLLRALYDAAVSCLKSRKMDGAEHHNALVLSAVLAALLLNGLVEFNFADGEIVLIYSLIMGCIAAGLRRLDAIPCGKDVRGEMI